ncbi:MAG: serine/threonine protein kinase [Deltaproteobacteria bacterium]|nr:serine/threonine protein kinase [Deltaproteobacteria bacterium]
MSDDVRDAFVPEAGLVPPPVREALLGGRYRLGEEWARGGMAYVFQGLLLGAAGFTRRVAIKRMLPALGDDPDFARLFVEEARVVTALSNPHIVEIIDLVYDEERRACIVMEWIDGVDLGTYRGLHARVGDSTKWPRIARVGLHTLRALAAAHERPEGPVFHRDVTPTNILLSTQGIAKLVDFGLARAGDRATMTSPGVVKGKLGYVAPELTAGQRPNAQTDLYALGVTLWEALAMRRAFDGKNAVELMVQAGKGGIPRLDTLRGDLPPELVSIVHQLCARDPAERFESARTAAKALAGLVDADLDDFQASVREVTLARDSLRSETG